MASPTTGVQPHPTNNDEPRISDPAPPNANPNQDQDNPDAPLPIESEFGAPPADEEEARWVASRPRFAWQARCRIIWAQSKGMVLVLLSQMFGASMNVMTQFLEIHSSMNPFQVCTS